MNITGFHHAVIYCTNTDSSRTCYEKLGLEYLRGYHGMHWFRLGSSEIMLHPSEHRPNEATPIIHLSVADVTGLFNHVVKQGLKPFDHQEPETQLMEPVTRPWGNIEFELNDPDGNSWAFTEKK